MYVCVCVCVPMAEARCKFAEGQLKKKKRCLWVKRAHRLVCVSVCVCVCARVLGQSSLCDLAKCRGVIGRIRQNRVDFESPAASINRHLKGGRLACIKRAGRQYFQRRSRGKNFSRRPLRSGATSFHSHLN